MAEDNKNVFEEIAKLLNDNGEMLLKPPSPQFHNYQSIKEKRKRNRPIPLPYNDLLSKDEKKYYRRAINKGFMKINEQGDGYLWLYNYDTKKQRPHKISLYYFLRKTLNLYDYEDFPNKTMEQRFNVKSFRTCQNQTKIQSEYPLKSWQRDIDLLFK